MPNMKHESSVNKLYELKQEKHISQHHRKSVVRASSMGINNYESSGVRVTIYLDNY